VTLIDDTLLSLTIQFNALTVEMDNLTDRFSRLIDILTESMVNHNISHGDNAFYSISLESFFNSAE
jgi:hypothetical protein